MVGAGGGLVLEARLTAPPIFATLPLGFRRTKQATGVSARLNPYNNKTPYLFKRVSCLFMFNLWLFRWAALGTLNIAYVGFKVSFEFTNKWVVREGG